MRYVGLIYPRRSFGDLAAAGQEGESSMSKPIKNLKVGDLIFPYGKPVVIIEDLGKPSPSSPSCMQAYKVLIDGSLCVCTEAVLIRANTPHLGENEST